MPKKQLTIYSFDMNCVGHINHGLWTHPRDRSTEFNTLDYWVDLAKTAERGLLDGIFIADIAGVYDVYKGGPETAIATAAQVPVNDPFLVVPVMAHATKHIGFGITASTSYEQPYLLARRFSTLDHLTDGRIGWNIVTGYIDSAARGLGFTQQWDHDHRYDVADDFLEASYKLWEGSWADDAVIADKARGLYADPAKVRAVVHDGPHYHLNAIHICSPSPQRTPLLYQAGASDRGRDFAAKHAECVFIAGPSQQIAKSTIAALRERAEAFGRARDDIKVFTLLSVVVGRTKREAEEKLEDYRRHASVEAGLAHYSASIGIDFAKYEMDEPIRFEKTNANQSTMEAITKRAPEAMTKRRIIDQIILGSRQAPLVGSPQEIADYFESWADIADVDGFNLARTVTPEGLTDFVDLVVPVLQERGLFKREYAPGPLREKLFGHAKLKATHPGSRLKFGVGG